MWSQDMGIRALSIDGGGVRALSQLVVLQYIMAQMKTRKGGATRICDCFEIIGGTGTGAIIAILLGRLGLTVEEAIEEYIEFMTAIFPNSDDWEEESPAFETSKVVEAVEQLLARQDVPLDAKLNHVEDSTNKCKVIICTVSTTDQGSVQLFRSYDSRASYMECTIVDAISTSIASPSMFQPVPIGPPDLQQLFISADHISSNPTRELLKEARLVFGDTQRVACILNIGSGKPRVLSLGDEEEEQIDGLMSVLEGIATDAETAAEELANQFTGVGVYSRLSVDRGLEGVDMHNWMEFSIINTHTRAYLRSTEVTRTVQHCLDVLRNPIGAITLDRLTQSAYSEASFASLPPITPYFVMRQEIWDAMLKAFIDEEFEDFVEMQRIMVISGMCGVGKTQTCVKFATEHLSYFSHVFFIDASSHVTLKGDLQAAIRSLGDANQTAEDALSYFSEEDYDESGRSWLLIYDNANDPDLDLQSFLPRCQHGSIIITTRNRDLGQFATAGHEHLGPMSDEEAVEVVLRAGRRPTQQESPDDADIALAIAKELGNLPLALVRAGSYAYRRKCFKNYLKIYRQNRNKFMDEASSEKERYYSSVYASIETSYKVLPSSAKELLNILSFFHHSKIPRSIFRLAASNDFLHDPVQLDLPRGHSIRQTAHQLQTIFYSEDEWDEYAFYEKIHALQIYSLIWLDQSTSDSFLNLHPLVASCRRDKLSPAETQRYRELAIRMLVSCMGKDQPENFRTSLVPHVLEIVKHGDLHPNDSAALASLLEEEGRFEEAIPLRRQVVDACRLWNGEQHPSTVDSLAKLVDDLENVGLLEEALKEQSQVADLRKEMMGSSDPATVEAVSRRASMSLQLSRMPEETKTSDEITSTAPPPYTTKDLKAASIILLSTKSPVPTAKFPEKKSFGIGSLKGPALSRMRVPAGGLA